MIEISKNDQKIIQKIDQKFKKVFSDYRLIENGDHILVGLSGGKDSLALVELLGQKMKVFLPKFKVTAVHISVENISYQSDIEYLKEFCSKYNIDFVHHITSFNGQINPSKSTCFLCSWHRRKALFQVAEELCCNKIALGHQLDDIVETFLMNLIFQGSLSTMPPLLEMDKFEMTIIRPLALISENEVIEMARIRNYPAQIKNCPHEKESSRSQAKQLVADLEKMNPDIRQSIWAAMENIKIDYLPQKTKKKQIDK